MGKIARLGLAAGLLIFLVFAVMAGDYALFLSRPVAPQAPLTLDIPPGTSLTGIATRLSEEGVLTRPGYFRLLARLQGKAGQIQAGEYRFSDPAEPGKVLERLVRGDVRRYPFTVPEGFTTEEIASKLEKEGLGRAASFLALAHDPGTAAALGVEAASLEGYLFPETYVLSRDVKERALLTMMVGEFERRVDDSLRRAAQRRDLDLHQLVTLASIIQKEAGNEEEMPLISAVFHNRLRRGMRLQADPTVIYGIKDFAGNLTRRHLREKTPYNTYRISGLPPGPIANPGMAALQAAAHPADSDALYFVSRGDGTHVFSNTLQEHNRAVRRFQLKR